jgi:hypothetical protein
MEPFGDFLGDQEGVAAVTVVDNEEVDPNLIFYGLILDRPGGPG